MRIATISDNAFWVVTTQRARDNSRIPDTSEDDWIQYAIESAHDYFERTLGCCIATTQFRAKLDQFPRNRASIELPVWPIAEVTRLAYLDSEGNEQDIPLEQIVQPVDQGRYAIRLANHARFPEAKRTPNAVTIDFTAGWPEPAAVPKTLTRAALMLISHWYENREAVLVGTASKEIEIGTSVLLEHLRPDEDMTAAEVEE